MIYCTCPCHNEEDTCMECCDGGATRLRAELQRFREREPLVQAFIDSFETVKRCSDDPLTKVFEIRAAFKQQTDALNGLHAFGPCIASASAASASAADLTPAEPAEASESLGKHDPTTR